MAFVAGTPDVVFGSGSLSRLPEKLDELLAALDGNAGYITPQDC